MKSAFIRKIGAATVASLLVLAVPAIAGDSTAKAQTEHGHDHAHDHDHGNMQGQVDGRAAQRIGKGYFADDQIAGRDLSDWAGEWQSVYPLLLAGRLDPVMDHKAAHGEKSAQEYRSYYETGYRTDVDRITIAGDRVTFHRASTAVEGQYAADGHEILTYKAGNRGVRFIFQKIGGDALAPRFIQFSDHRIAPARADHYHLYWGDDRAEVLAELTNWPTFYPAGLTVDQIVTEMTAH
ncbi:metal-binding protein ZinT [Paracoccus sp. M683]|uniref:ZinT family metal-binding protein n=1 Tax=Paracoccus sp. M683 TaxID=2594268 RepID=UPI00117EB2E9|nr:metal-binding protein ZinT [Paracoccus sp. M683]TRW98144.1 metal-binding protein ZinT [Paracoccus sp. M683]